VPDVVTSLHLAIRLEDFGQHPFLISNIRLHGVRNEEVGASAGSPRQLAKRFLISGLGRMLKVAFRVFAMNTS
jgi:hypothetical protein